MASNTVVDCPNYEQKPRVRVRIESETTGYTYTYRWRGALPVVGFPRVEPGRYEVRTKATCGTTTKTWVESVEVKEKTAERTVSPAEWRRVKRGMTLSASERSSATPVSSPGTATGARRTAPTK